jgi:hypothetical protein
MRTVSDQTWFIRMSQATRVLAKTFPCISATSVQHDAEEFIYPVKCARVTRIPKIALLVS